MSENTKINITFTRFIIIGLSLIVLIAFLNWQSSKTTNTETAPPALASGVSDEKTFINNDEIKTLKEDLEKSKKDLEDLKLKTEDLEKKN